MNQGRHTTGLFYFTVTRPFILIGMEKNIPVYKLLIDPRDESGISFVALVDDPAIQRHWLAFRNQKQCFRVSNGEQRIISGPLLLADYPIYRADKQLGEHYVVFDKDTIRQAVYKFFRQGNTSNVNLMHSAKAQVPGIYLFESFIIDSKRGLPTPKGFDTLPEGSWFGSYKVDNDEVWNTFIKSGEFRGFSVEGLFEYSKNATPEETMLENILQVIRQVNE